MTTVEMTTDMLSQQEDLMSCFESACDLIAPTWPLDQLIAVNPLWEMRHFDIQDVVARMAALDGANGVMPPEFYRAMKNLVIEDRHINAAARQLGLRRDSDGRYATVEKGDHERHWLSVSGFLDADRDAHSMAWRDEIVQQISQFCASSFQQGGSCANDAEQGTLYSQWLESTRHDLGISIIMGEPGLRAQFRALPDCCESLLREAGSELCLTESSAELYAHSLLLDIKGWASWVAYLRWQARLNGGSCNLMMDLLAIRMAWDLAVWRNTRQRGGVAFIKLQSLWQRQLACPDALLQTHRNQLQGAWLWQCAAERAFQEQLLHRIFSNPPAAESGTPPALQAVFCIDVRSEVFRRHLEAQDPTIETKGFAGFFGLPLEHQLAATTYARPQLPGLLAPSLTITTGTNDLALARTGRRSRWGQLGDAPPAMFGLVESSGPLYALKLLKDSFFPAAHQHPVNALSDFDSLQVSCDGVQLTPEQCVDLAAGVLNAMGLKQGFAPTVMLVGHGSSSANNPHAASLDCGACGGQTGELNARVLASILNDSEVRCGLADQGITIPAKTRFVAALHDTATDEVTILQNDPVPEQIQTWLSGAGTATRRERASRLKLSSLADKDLANALKRRARDWSQVRPEWGLADNAAFVVAPRKRTRGVDLQGRVFLHDYRWQDDTDFSVLELIMTAPMIVTHWINMQYNTSVVDNLRYGSGNKVLHNVVGGNLGVFEGNGGDLRIGLPMQSLHDGQHWMHTPLRLSVYLQAPAEAIHNVYSKHEVVRQLIDNGWLYLFRLNDHDGECERLFNNQ
ncbi:MAG: DUF2309 domain-containing protein [Gammaproteobacteria bacterium]|nr:DUF2309 domain-containing protein [Pseudomonadales bacterium]MCP5347396.1 DUF2309 domain-containing protein [Pseudomonadales bacterium]